MGPINCLNFKSQACFVINTYISTVLNYESTEVNAMIPQHRRKRDGSGRTPRIAPDQMLDALFALDCMVVELSMRVYNVSRRERFILRKQNRRLHDAFRKHLPRHMALFRTRS